MGKRRSIFEFARTPLPPLETRVIFPGMPLPPVRSPSHLALPLLRPLSLPTPSKLTSAHISAHRTSISICSSPINTHTCQQKVPIAEGLKKQGYKEEHAQMTVH